VILLISILESGGMPFPLSLEQIVMLVLSVPGAVASILIVWDRVRERKGRGGRRLKSVRKGRGK